MKKIVSALLAVLLVLGMSGAMAATVTEVSTIEGMPSVISGTNLMYNRGENGCALIDINGNALTADEYYYDFYQYHGHLTVTKTGGEELASSGLLALDGSVAVPFQYSEVEVINENWALGVMLVVADGEEYDYSSWSSDDKYLIESVDVYYLPEKKLMTTLTRDQYGEADAYGQYLNICDRQGKVTGYDSAFNVVGAPSYTHKFDYVAEALTSFQNDEYLCGLKTVGGEVLVEAQFEHLYPEVYSLANGLVRFGKDGKYGLIDLEGNIVIPAEYDNIVITSNGVYEPTETYRYVCGGYICVEKDNKIGYVDLSGNVTCDVSIDDDTSYNYGMTSLIEDNDKYSIAAADGVITKLKGYDAVYVLEHSGGRYYEVRNDKSDYGVIDWHGEIVVPLEYDNISMMGDGQHILVSADGEYKILKIEE